MIPKGTNVVVNFYATNSDGIPLSTAAGITPYYRYIGSTGLESNSIACNIYSVGSDAPGWFYFSTNSFATSDPGNLFITFHNNSGYIIAPWEDDIVPVGGASAADIWDHSFSGSTASAYLYSASANAYSAYTAANGLPDTGAIATSVWDINKINHSAIAYIVWGPEAYNQIQNIKDAQTAIPSYHTAIEQIVPDVWSHSWGTPTAVSAYSYLTSIYNNTSSITIPTPPTTGEIATSVWAHTSRSITTTFVNDGAVAGNETYIATGSNVSGIPSAVWTYNIGPDTTTASTYLGSIGAIPTTSSIATSVWTYSTEGNPSSDRSLTYYPAFPTDYAKPGDAMALTAAAVTSVQTGLAKTTDIPTVPTAGDIATSVWSYSWSVSDVWSSAYQYVNTISSLASSANTAAGSAITAANNAYTSASSAYDAVNALTIPTPPSEAAIASAVWSYGDENNSRTVDNMLTSANVWSYQIGGSTAGTLLGSIGVPPSAAAIASSVWTYGDDDLTGNTIRTVDAETIWSFNISRGLPAGSALSTVLTKVVFLPGSLSAISAGLFNWSLVSSLKLVTYIGNTETEYSVSRDGNMNIIGVSPIQQ